MKWKLSYRARALLQELKHASAAHQKVVSLKQNVIMETHTMHGDDSV